MGDYILQAVAEDWTMKKVPRADGSNDCLGAACALIFIIFLFIFYAILNGFFTMS